MAILHVPASFPTIQSAVNAASPGDTILVAPGTYDEEITITTNSIHLIATTPNTVVIRGMIESGYGFGSGSGSGSGITLNNVSDVEIANFVLQNQSNGAIRISQGGFNHIRNNQLVGSEPCKPCKDECSCRSKQLVGSGLNGIVLENTTGNLMIQNKITNYSNTGITFSAGSNSNRVIDNIFKSNVNAHVFIAEDGGTGNAMIENSMDQGKIGFLIFDSNTLIFNNTITNVTESAIDIQNGDSQKIIGNQTSKNTGIDIFIGSDETPVTESIILNNMINGSNGGIVISQVGSFTTVYNNDVRNQKCGIPQFANLGNSSNYVFFYLNKSLSNIGIGLSTDGSNVNLLDNRLCSNKQLDLFVSGLQNTVMNSICKTSNPPGLCTKPCIDC